MQQVTFFILWLTVCALLALLGSLLTHINFFLSYVLTAIVLLVSSFIAERDRRKPGHQMRIDITREMPLPDDEKKDDS